MAAKTPKNFKLLGILLLSTLLIGCSPQSLATKESLAGTLIGTGLGAGAGIAIGQAAGDTALNAAVNGGIGAGVGLVTGALVHEYNKSQKEVVVRQSRMIGENQERINTLQQETTEATSWGQGESRSWNERYIDNEVNLPYQGNAGPSF